MSRHRPSPPRLLAPRPGSMVADCVKAARRDRRTGLLGLRMDEPVLPPTNWDSAPAATVRQGACDAAAATRRV